MEKVKTAPFYMALEPADAALILREDGSFETSFPEDYGVDTPEHVLTAAAIAYALRDESLLEVIMDNFFNQCQTMLANADE